MNLRLGLIISIVIIISIVGWALYQRNPEKPLEEQENANVVSEISPQSGLDSDKDGLKDWEEALWKSDPNSADSDGDGTSDGNEVKTGRNPIKTPPDQLSVEIINQIKAESAIFEQKDTKNTSISTQKEENPLKTYGNQLAQALKEHDLRVKDREQALFTTLTGGNTLTSSDFKEIAVISTAYQELSSHIGALQEPEKATRESKNLSYSYTELSNALKMLASYEKSGSISNDAFQSYNEAATRVGNSIIAVVLLFKNEGIVFSKNEPGAIFNF